MQPSSRAVTPLNLQLLPASSYVISWPSPTMRGAAVASLPVPITRIVSRTRSNGGRRASRSTHEQASFFVGSTPDRFTILHQPTAPMSIAAAKRSPSAPMESLGYGQSAPLMSALHKHSSYTAPGSGWTNRLDREEEEQMHRSKHARSDASESQAARERAAREAASAEEADADARAEAAAELAAAEYDQRYLDRDEGHNEDGEYGSCDSESSAVGVLAFKRTYSAATPVIATPASPIRRYTQPKPTRHTHESRMNVPMSTVHTNGHISNNGNVYGASVTASASSSSASLYDMNNFNLDHSSSDSSTSARMLVAAADELTVGAGVSSVHRSGTPVAEHAQWAPSSPKRQQSACSDDATKSGVNESEPQRASLIGVWIARCLLLEMLVVGALIVVLYFGCSPLLRWMGEPASAIEVASAYVSAASVGLPFVAMYHSLNKGLQSSGIVLPVLLISLGAKIFSCITVYVGIFHLGMSLVGIAWILSASIASQAIAVYSYMAYVGITTQWFGSNAWLIFGGGAEGPMEHLASLLNGLYEYSALAFPACMAIILEFMLFDIIGALAGLLPNPSVELSVHYLLFTSTLASYMLFSGLSVSVSVLVGQRLGIAGQSHNAKRSAIIGTSACLLMSGCLILVLVFFHDTIGRLLSSNPALLARFAECVPVLICYQLVDGLNTCSTQLLRTLGVQKYGVLLHFTTYYAIGMSTAYVLAFHFGYGVQGLWMGLCVGVGLNASIATLWLWSFANWEEQEQAAIMRTAMMNAADAACIQADEEPTPQSPLLPSPVSVGTSSHESVASYPSVHSRYLSTDDNRPTANGYGHERTTMHAMRTAENGSAYGLN
jgi:MATE family multidrug resistance protein